ncbi:MAG: LuxR C-terminal-related transcriptional regulator [Gemmataceae bacterium]
MSKTQRLKADDLVQIYRLIGECRDLGRDAAGWRIHLLTALLRNLGAMVGTSAQFHDALSECPRPVGDVDIGWLDPKDREYRQRHLEECGFSTDPHWERMADLFRAGPSLLATDRAQMVSDREWYRSAHFNEFRRPTRSDSSLYFGYTATDAGPDVILAFALTRTLKDRKFTARERQYCYWLLHELRPLVGRQLAAPGEARISDLSPRLQQTLQCLMEGDSEKQAAVRLGLSKATVHEYVTALYRRFGVNSRAELLVHWGRQGFDRVE